MFSISVAAGSNRQVTLGSGVPELPEVEVLVRHLRAAVIGQKIDSVVVNRTRVIAPTTPNQLAKALAGAEFVDLSRRGKYLIFKVCAPRRKVPLEILGHLGMTGRMYLLPSAASLPKHAAVVLNLGNTRFVFEDTRYFGRFTLDRSALERLGPEPLSDAFSLEYFQQALGRSSQAIKVKLLDQSLVAGIGNIYASEVLFRAGVSPRLSSRKLSFPQVKLLWKSVRNVLEETIRNGSSMPLAFEGGRDGLFYFGSQGRSSLEVEERFCVYDRAGKPCSRCGYGIRRLVQAARSTFFCPNCQRIIAKTRRRSAKSN